MTEGKTYIH